ncbi:hypothetical protein FOA43_003726 [Brettanomyces nanus]|uniref:FAS1 domain-containing protein n=1 Tax=Eeniella nana TaxID=13502 RepID=A0A875RQA4_EENNA|nr:uncharacterized protein FOA43_003726 [Brettanomyces nanus]QPG76340.1 hypothetical protein FOA43_003726 [Brettanomyces nanus]
MGLYMLFGMIVVDAKNVVDISISDEAIAELSKRSPKNTFDAFHLIVDDAALGTDSNHVKRSPKNIAHLNLVVDESKLLGETGKLQRRSSKNVAHLDLVIDEDELLSRLIKRDSKNLADLDFVIDEKDLVVTKIKKDNDEEFTQLAFKLTDGDSSYSFIADLPQKVVAKLSNGYHQLKLKFSNDSHAIPEVGDIYDAAKKLKYTLMPSVKSGSLATALNEHPDISIFASYVRDLNDLYNMCDSTDDFNINAAASSKAENMLLLFSPTNEAILSLQMKPWQFPKSAHASDSDDVAQENIRHFVESHIAKVSSKSFNADRVVTLSSLNGNTIFLKNTDTGFMYKLSETDQWLTIKRIEVLDNGALLSIDRTMSWPGKQ